MRRLDREETLLAYATTKSIETGEIPLEEVISASCYSIKKKMIRDGKSSGKMAFVFWSTYFRAMHPTDARLEIKAMCPSTQYPIKCVQMLDRTIIQRHCMTGPKMKSSTSCSITLFPNSTKISMQMKATPYSANFHITGRIIKSLSSGCNSCLDILTMATLQILQSPQLRRWA